MTKNISFDIPIKIKKTFSLPDEVADKLDKHLKSIKEENRSKWLFEQLVLWLRASNPNIKNIDDLLELSDLKQEDFMYKFMEVLERLGLDIPRNKFSQEFSARIEKIVNLESKKEDGNKSK